MSEPVEDINAEHQKVGSRLAEAIRDVKNAVADRDDVVVDIREAQRTRLELLADDLKPVFADVDEDDERFDFAISAGAQPRLWIDSVAHVTMGRDRRTYRFLRDTRLGRVVLAESSDIKKVADQVTRYIAERVIERRRMLEGEVTPLDPRLYDKEKKGSSVLRGLGIILLGGLVGVAVILMLSWPQVADMLGRSF
ncbi:hypothetical protein [Neoaquamicrobium sediminum]|uniref:hypothetical protein n=1 Tax=Neoaquamicrobium sediminum TaxID=1849104 RepID=UPI003BAC932F